MIDERSEELASLYALDLLDGAERTAFESAIAADPALARLVAELREAAAALAHAAPPAEPPAALKARVLASAGPSKFVNREVKIVRPPLALFRTVLPWAAAAGFAGVAAWLGERHVVEQAEAVALREQVTLGELALKSSQNQNEAAQIVARRQLEQLNQQVAVTAAQLAGMQQRATGAEDQLATAARDLANANSRLDDAAQQVAALTQRLDASTRSNIDASRHELELDRLLNAAKTQITALEQKLKTEGDLANLKITTLASMLKNSPQALAVAVWNPEKQQGVLRVEKLPALAADKTYQLWVVDPQYPAPVDGGVFSVDPQTGAANVTFTGKQPVAAINAFAVTLERKGGVPKAEGPFVLLGK